MADELEVEKRGRGQPPHKPSDEQRNTVRTMTAYGIPQDAISAVIGISEPTLRKHYENEIATALAEANSKMAQCLFQQAMNGSTAAAIFWLKARAGWSEKFVNEHTGADGVPLVPPTITVNFVRPSDSGEPSGEA